MNKLNLDFCISNSTAWFFLAWALNFETAQGMAIFETKYFCILPRFVVGAENWDYEYLYSSSAFRIVRHVFIGQHQKPYWQDRVTGCFSGLIFFMGQNGTFLKISALSKLMLQCHIDNMVTEKIESPNSLLYGMYKPWQACKGKSVWLTGVYTCRK